jgi:flagellar biosynthesis/type III secretory pathway M-ring protein FliF/YscJ
VLVTATSITFPVTVSNALSVPITVNVTVDPQSTLLRIDKRQVPLKVEANATGRALIGAQALGPGTVQATITLHSAASPEVPVGVADTIRVDLRPSWEGIGTAIAAVLLLLIFGGGIVRQVLRRRRRRAEPDADAAAGPDGPAAGPDADTPDIPAAPAADAADASRDAGAAG